VCFRYFNINYNWVFLFGLMSIMGLSCKKAYEPPALKFGRSSLVVEGIINSGGDSTIIKLSKTVPVVDGHIAQSAELHAAVSVEDDQNNILPLTETGNGKYVSPGLTINNSRQYRLRVKTADNNEYVSDFVPVQATPPIDSLGYSITGSGLQVYVNAHDPTNKVQYYRWDYDEAWEFHAYYESNYILKGNDIVPRIESEKLYYCFGNDVSSDIPLATTTKSTQAVLNQMPIALVPSSSEKLSMRYSILVRQYALTREAYDFYSLLKKNSESLGSIFDPMPSEIQGNMHCTNNPALPVIGFISANNVVSKRIFISNSSLPSNWIYVSPYGCTLNPFITADIIATLKADPKAAYFISAGTLGTPICSDCTLRGNLNAPSFWVY